MFNNNPIGHPYQASYYQASYYQAGYYQAPLAQQQDLRLAPPIQDVPILPNILYCNSRENLVTQIIEADNRLINYNKNKSDIVDSLLLSLPPLFDSNALAPLTKTDYAEAVINLAFGHIDSKIVIEGTDPLLWTDVLKAYNPEHRLPQDLYNLRQQQLLRPFTGNVVVDNETSALLANTLCQRAQFFNQLYLPLASNLRGSMHHTMVELRPTDATRQQWQLQHYDTNNLTLRSASEPRHTITTYVLPANMLFSTIKQLLEQSRSRIYQNEEGIVAIQQLTDSAKREPFSGLEKRYITDCDTGQPMDSCSIGCALFAMNNCPLYDTIPMLNNSAQPITAQPNNSSRSGTTVINSQLASSHPLSKLGIRVVVKVERHIDITQATAQDVEIHTKSVKHHADEWEMANRPIIQSPLDPNKAHDVIPQPHFIKPEERAPETLEQRAFMVFGDSSFENQMLLWYAFEKIEQMFQDTGLRVEHELKYFQVVDSISLGAQPKGIDKDHPTTGIRGVVAKIDIPAGTPLIVSSQVMNEAESDLFYGKLGEWLEQEFGFSPRQAQTVVDQFSASYTWQTTLYKSTKYGDYKSPNMLGAGNVAALCNSDEKYANMRPTALRTHGPRKGQNGHYEQGPEVTVYIAVRDIPQGEQILTDYGEEYNFAAQTPQKVQKTTRNMTIDEGNPLRRQHQWQLKQPIKQETTADPTPSAFSGGRGSGSTGIDHDTDPLSGTNMDLVKEATKLSAAKRRLTSQHMGAVAEYVLARLVPQPGENKPPHTQVGIAGELGIARRKVNKYVVQYTEKNPNSPLTLKYRQYLDYRTDSDKYKEAIRTMLHNRKTLNTPITREELVKQIGGGETEASLSKGISKFLKENPDDPVSQEYNKYIGFGRVRYGIANDDLMRKLIAAKKADFKVTKSSVARTLGIDIKTARDRIMRYINNNPNSQLTQECTVLFSEKEQLLTNAKFVSDVIAVKRNNPKIALKEIADKLNIGPKVLQMRITRYIKKYPDSDLTHRYHEYFPERARKMMQHLKASSGEKPDK